MTSDTFSSKNLGSVYAGLGEPKGKTRPKLVYDSSTYPGYVVRTDSSDRWNLAKNSDKSQDAVIDTCRDHGLDTAFTIYSGTVPDVVEGYRIGGGDVVWTYYVAVSPAVNLLPGDILVTSATDGMTMKFSYTDGTDITDAPLNIVGRCVDIVTGSTSDNKLVKVQL
jgi:hypothetical protein